MNLKNTHTGVVHELHGCLVLCEVNLNLTTSNPHNVFGEEDAHR